MRLHGYQGGDLGLFVAGEDIAEGAPIQVNYGTSAKSLMWGKYPLPNRLEVRSWFKRGTEERLKEFEKPSLHEGNIGGVIAKNMKAAKLAYPLYTPAAILDLVFSGTTTIRDWLALVNQKNSRFFQGLHGFDTEMSEFMNLLRRLLKFEENLNASPNVLQVSSQWILNQIGNLSVMQLMEAIERIGEACAKKELDINSWDAFKAKLEYELPEYDWLKDKNASLGFKRRCEDMLETFLTLDNPLKTAREELEQARKLGNDEEGEAVLSHLWLIEQLEKS